MRRRIGIGALLVALLAIWLATDGWDRSGSADRSREEAEPSAAERQQESAIGAESDPEERRDAVEPGEVVAERAREADRVAPIEERPAGRLRVEVSAGGRPVEGAVIELAGGAEPAPAIFADGAPRAFERRAVSGADGVAVVEALLAGRYVVRASAIVEGGERQAARFVRVDESGSTVELELEGQARLVLRIVDERSTPVSGAVVEIVGGGDGNDALDPGDFRASVVSDGAGRAPFDAGGLAGYVAVATAPDGRAGSRVAWRRDNVQDEISLGAVDLVVGSPATLSGRVLGVEAEDLRGAQVLAHLIDCNGPYYRVHKQTFAAPVDEGRWTFAALPAGSYVLDLRDPAGARFDWPSMARGGELPNSLAPTEIVLEAAEHEHIEVRAVRGATLEGVVRDERDRPLAGSRVHVTFAPVCQDFPDGFVLHGAHVWRFDAPSRADDDHPATHRRATTAADGGYRFVGLPRGRVRVEVAAQGRTYDRREAVELVEGETRRLEHRLERAGAIVGVRREGGYLGVRSTSGDRIRGELVRVAVLARDGLFRFDGLAPARYGLVAAHSDETIAPVLLGEVEVRAGATTWIDLDRVADEPFRLKGVVLERGLPVPRAIVRWSGRSTVTGELGEFEFGSAFPPVFPEIGVRTIHGGLDVHHAVAAPSRSSGEWTCELGLGLDVLSVRAFDASGAPSSATLALSSSSLAAPGIRSVTLAERRIDGGALDVIGLFPGEYSVEVEFPDGAVARCPARVPANEPLIVRAPPSGRITVRLSSRDGVPIPGRRITASTKSDAEPASGEPRPDLGPEIEGVTDAGGLAELRGIRPGEVVVRARRQVERSEWRTRVTAHATVSLAQGEHRTLELVDDGL